MNDVFIAKRNGDSLKGYVASSTNNQVKNNTAFLVSRGTDPRIISKATFDFNEWHHISINYNAAEKQVSLFVDGVFDSAVQDFPSPLPTQSSLYIGKDGYLNTYYFNGSLDEIRIYGRELSSLEIQGLSGSGIVTETKLSNSSLQKSISAYPNPCSDEVNILLTYQSACTAQIEIVNPFGEKVKSFPNTSLHQGDNSLKIPTDNLPSGQYLIKITGTDNVLVQKISVTH